MTQHVRTIRQIFQLKSHSEVSTTRSELTTNNAGRKAKTLDEDIAAQRDKLRKLEERERDQQRKERDKNQKAVMELIKKERLDAVPPALWREAMPKIKALLVGEPAKAEEPAKPLQKTTEGVSAVDAIQ